MSVLGPGSALAGLAYLLTHNTRWKLVSMFIWNIHQFVNLFCKQQQIDIIEICEFKIRVQHTCLSL